MRRSFARAVVRHLKNENLPWAGRVTAPLKNKNRGVSVWRLGAGKDGRSSQAQFPRRAGYEISSYREGCALSFLAAPCVAQTPRAAQDHFNRGESLYQKGDFEARSPILPKPLRSARDWTIAIGRAMRVSPARGRISTRSERSTRWQRRLTQIAGWRVINSAITARSPTAIAPSRSIRVSPWPTTIAASRATP